MATFLRVRGVAGTVFDPDGEGHFLNRCAQVSFDVCSECFQRGNIERVETLVRAIGEFDEGREKTGEGFSAACGCYEQEGGVARSIEHVLLVRMDGPATCFEPIGKISW